MKNLVQLRYALVAASSLAALGVSMPAMAQTSDTAGSLNTASYGGYHGLNPDEVDDIPSVVPRDDLDPNAPPPNGILDDSGINGVGQMIIWNGDGGVGLCTGTLINPRTVLFAAHCANSRPADAYGSQDGGTPMGFGFEADNLPATIDWINSGFNSVVGSSFFNVEHLYYIPESVNPAGNFLQADVAIATLDTPAFDIPTWAMLFTPLDEQAHVTVTGYGRTGNGTLGDVQGVDFRRRIGENYVSFLGSLADRNEFLFGNASGALPQNLYMTSFSDPAGSDAFNPAEGRFDFGLFGDNDVALPRESGTAGGDSGGPLIVDEKYDVPVVIGVLSGGSRFFGAQPFSSYGGHSFYQPLHAYWDVIVANNPYVYATTKGGIGQWTDPGHWIQAMDPNYLVDLDGELINRLPDAPGQGTSGDGAKFGDVCFLSDCQDFTQAGVVGATGDEFFVEGGPGTQNFVPNNIKGSGPLGIRARYFDVTLTKGITQLQGADITIDKFTVNGPTFFDLDDSASLTSLGDFNQIAGWSNIDGTLAAREAFIMGGVLSGSGTIRAPFVTVIDALVAPGGFGKAGTLTVDGNLILTSATDVFMDANRRENDMLDVTGILSLSDVDDTSNGASLFFTRGLRGPAPRFGQVVTIATAGQVQGEFANVYSFTGVLRPELTYTDTTITAELRAQSFFGFLKNAKRSTIAFAKALDKLRYTSYDSLYNLYGTIDLLDEQSLTLALDGLAPRINDDAHLLEQQQAAKLFDGVTDRLSLMGNASSGSLNVSGSVYGVVGQNAGNSPAARNGFANLSPDQTQELALPEGFTGFVTGGMLASHNSAGNTGNVDDRQQSRYFGMGIEHEVRENLTIGVAYGYASGIANTGADNAQSEMNQVSAYGSYQLGEGAYVGFAGNYQLAETDMARIGWDGASQFDLRGDRSSERLTALAETGVNLAVSQGLTLTPRVQVAYNRTHLNGFEEVGGETALAIDDYSTSQIEARLGAKLAGSETIGNGWTLVPQMQANYVRMLDGADNGLSVRFAAASDVPILLPLANGDSNWAELKGGISVTRGLVKFGAGFETAIGRDTVRNDRAVADMSIRF